MKKTTKQQQTKTLYYIPGTFYQNTCKYAVPQVREALRGVPQVGGETMGEHAADGLLHRGARAAERGRSQGDGAGPHRRIGPDRGQLSLLLGGWDIYWLAHIYMHVFLSCETYLLGEICLAQLLLYVNIFGF